MVSILDAESLLSTSKKDHSRQVIESYRDGILLAKRKGFIQDQALGNERLAEFHIHQSQQTDRTKKNKRRRSRNKKSTYADDDDEEASIGNIDVAVCRFGEAKRLYQEWGAYALVDKVEERCSKLVSQQQQWLITEKEIEICEIWYRYLVSDRSCMVDALFLYFSC